MNIANPASSAPGQGVASIKDVLDIETRNPDLIGSVRSTYDLISRGARLMPDAPAMSFFLRTQDYRQPHVWKHKDWMGRITQAANLFRRLGVERGDVVAFILPNLPETHWVIWGGEASGIVLAINPLLEPSLMTELMNAAKPRVLVTLAPTPETDIWEKASAAASKVPSLKHILTVSPLKYLRNPMAPVLQLASRLRTPKQIGHARVSAFHALLGKEPADRLAFAPPALDDVASYFCTGGTTGLPKIAVRTHRTEVANAIELTHMLGRELSGNGKSYFCGLPLFHVNAQIATGLMLWATGSHAILGTPQGYRTPGLIANFWDIAAHYRFTTFSGVPTVYSALLQQSPAGKDLSHLKFGVCGAAPMPLELIQRFQREIGIKILEGYGLTEGGCVSSINPPQGETRSGSIGIRLPWQDMRAAILDADGIFVRDAFVNEVGTILIKGPNLFRAYLNPIHNKGLWVNRAGADNAVEKWLNTGDLGRMDEQGYFWLTGRKKELIIRGGHNIDPKMIEDAMHEHPAVALAAAVGRPDAHAGEVPVLYVQLRTNTSAAAADLLKFAHRNIAERAAWPKDVKVLSAIPTTAVGKIFKPALTQMEMKSVLLEEARATGVKIETCEVVQNPTRGLLLRWSASGDVSALEKRLGLYTFPQERLSTVTSE